MIRRALVLAAVIASLNAGPAVAQTLRAGMIGLDTSHVPAFTKALNDPKAKGDMAAVKVVAGYPGGTDMPASADRVERFTQQVKEMGVEIVDSIPTLLAKVDVVLLESVDGRIHLEQAIPVILAGKPMFIDKPVAGSLADAIAIFELAKQRNVPVWSSSSLRYNPNLVAALKDQKLGDVVGAISWGPCSIQDTIPDLYFYGVHGVEGLYTVMGTGCKTVVRTHADGTDVVTGEWEGGRIGTYRGIRAGKSDYGIVIFGSKSVVRVDRGGGYEHLLAHVATFFKTHKPPVSAEETIELFAFMEAADESKRRGGAPVSIAETIEKARAEAMTKLAAITAAQ